MIFSSQCLFLSLYLCVFVNYIFAMLVTYFSIIISFRIGLYFLVYNCVSEVNIHLFSILHLLHYGSMIMDTDIQP